MGLLNFFADRERKAELRESKDEMLVGEIVRAMLRQGYPSVRFSAHNDRQRIKFRAIDDDVLSAVYITLDRKTGTGAVSSALIGSKATLHITCEVRNYLADPDDLLHMYKTDMANLFKVSWGDIKINHEYNAIQGTTRNIIDIDDYVDNGAQGVEQFVEFLSSKIAEVREKLRPYKKGNLPE